ncbi:hypothetical protein LHP98_11975 [Rhodobacter sp. Har01]|uniref:hypothetical protein n=1 Tax=Rhodobacter sp. Har01 TaxID=2883999 RepID=UPI001D08D581|nr:hypothetical protein [Rhodobacter sp. Har01]MCB6178843.1 hypothetical protein [Rhodobacter sp. Har01]
MAGDLPDYYFRIRENGAAVFKVDTENRQRRIELVEIAAVNVRNGNVKPHGETKLAAADLAAIEDWLTRRRKLLEARDVDDILRAVDHLNLTTQWVQAKATNAQLDQVTDALLLAMHDLRSVLVRKKAERLTRDEASG